MDFLFIDLLQGHGWHSSGTFTFSECKEYACSAGDPGSVCVLGRSPGEGNGYPLQYSCLEKPMDRGAWQPTAPEVTKSQSQLSV